MATSVIHYESISIDPTLTFNSSVTDNGTEIFRFANIVFINFNFTVSNGLTQGWTTVGSVTPLPANGVILEYATITPSVTVGIWVKDTGEIACGINGSGSYTYAIRGLLVYST